MLLEDSDENSETDESEVSEFEVDTGALDSEVDSSASASSDSGSGDFEEQLEKIMGKAIAKKNFDKQIKEATTNLQERYV